MAASRDVDLSRRFQKLSIPGQDESTAFIGNVPKAPGQNAPTAAAEAARPADADAGAAAPDPIIPANHSADWIVESAHYNKLSGTHSQGHFSVLYNGYNLSNSQCLPAGISALIYTQLFPDHRPSQWDRTDLYRILNQANNLYAQHLNGTAEADPRRAEQIRAKIVNNGYYLTGSEMKDNCLLFGRHFQIRKLGESYANRMFYHSTRGDRGARGLEYDLNEMFNRTAAAPPTASGQLMAISTKNALFLSRSYCRLVWKSADNKYYIFDSHFYPPSTESLVIETTSVKLLYDYLRKLLVEQSTLTSCNGIIADDNTQYELVPFEVEGPTSDFTPAVYFAENPSALDAPQQVVYRHPQPGENADANSPAAQAAVPIATIVRASDAQVGLLNPNAAADQNANVAANKEDTVPLPVPVPIEQFLPVQPNAEQADPEQQSVSMEVDVEPADVAAAEVVAVDAAEQADPRQQSVPMEVDVEPADAAAAVAAQPNTSWPVVAIFDAQVDTNGVQHYLCQWGNGVHIFKLIAEETLQESAAILLNLYKDHSGRFAGALFANNDGSSLDQRTADILKALDDAGERPLRRKVDALKTKLDSMDKDAEEYGSFVMMFTRLLFECEQLLNALAMKKAVPSKEEKDNWEKGCDDHFGEVNYRRHINWTLGKLNKN